METLPAPPGLATGQTSPQGGSGGAALGGPKKPTPAVMRWICPRRSGQSWQENLWNPRKQRKQMTVEQSTDESLTPAPRYWKAINWPQVRQVVRRLQMRIAKATQAGRHRKAQALQWLLTHSRAAKLLAVHRVTTNVKILRAAPVLCLARSLTAASLPAIRSGLFVSWLDCRRVPSSGAPVVKGLSRNEGNFQVRFLEGGGQVTARLHSACLPVGYRMA